MVRSDLNPVWDEVNLSLEAACNGDLDRAMKIVVYDHRRSGKHKFMGEFETNMRRILDAGTGESINFFTLRRQDQDVGTIAVVDALLQKPQKARKQPEPTKPESKRKFKQPPSDMPSSKFDSIPQTIAFAPRPDFVDYLGGGCEISLAVAIDFTASNGTFLILAFLHAVTFGSFLLTSCFDRGSSRTRDSSLLSSAVHERV